MKPILAADAFLRQYIGDHGRLWILVRNMRGRRVAIDGTTRRLLELCDGETDLETLARLSGRIFPKPLSLREIDQRLSPLLAEGTVVDAEKRVPGIVMPEEHRGIELRRLDESEAAAMRLSVPEGLGFDCDGSGSCCKLYDRIGLSNEDAARIQHHYDGQHTPGGLYPESALFLGRPGRNPLEFELAVVDGGCVMLNADGWCDVHARFGKDQKPRPCSIYPLRDVYCEGDLHIGVSVECRCVIKYATGPSITPLAEEVMDRRRKTRNVEQVAPEVPVLSDRLIKRVDYLEWRRRAIERLSRARDIAAWAMHEAARVAGGDLGEASSHLDVARQIAEQVRDLLDGEVTNVEGLYSERDYQRGHLQWGAQAAARLCERLTSRVPPTDECEGERLAAMQALYVHGAIRARSLCVGMFALALRLWMARAGKDEAHPEPLMPVSAVEYLHRAYGIGAIADAMQGDIEAALRGATMPD